MKPSLGRIVLLHNKFGVGDAEHPAIITKVWSDTCVNLTVFYDTQSTITETSVNQDEEVKEDKGWRWPPRVQE